MRTQLDTVKLLIHRIAWVLAYGEWPNKLIDHRDGNPSNNRLSNLRLADNSENMNNAKIPSTNTSGIVGVSLNGNGKWSVFYGGDKNADSKRYFGEFSNIEDAKKKYEQVKNEAVGRFLNS